jgi:hypothetical protein
MESEESRNKCPDCLLKKEISRKDDLAKTELERKKEKHVCVCHCKFSEISDQMTSNCAQAWRGFERNEDRSQTSPRKYCNPM